LEKVTVIGSLYAAQAHTRANLSPQWVGARPFLVTINVWWLLPTRDLCAKNAHASIFGKCAWSQKI